MQLNFNPNCLPARPQDKKEWFSLTGGGLALAVAQAAVHYEGLLLLITHQHQECFQLEEEIRFFLADAQVPVSIFPDWETLPYDTFSPHQDIISQRLSTLAQVQSQQKGVLITPITTLLHRLPPTDYIGQNSFSFKTGQNFNIEAERKRLERNGYICMNTVNEHGEFAVRGAIVDVFPMGSDQPIRIELFDDEIESLRSFDSQTQRSLKKYDAIELLPAREIPLDDAAIAKFKQAFRDSFDVDYRKCPLYMDINQGIASAGIEYYLPLFFDATATLLQYLPENTNILYPGDITPIMERFWEELTTRYEDRRHDIQRPLVKPEHLFIKEDEFFAALKAFSRTVIHTQERPAEKPHYHSFAALPLPDLQVDTQKQKPLWRLQNYLDSRIRDGFRILLCAESAGRRETLHELLHRHAISAKQTASWQDFLQTNAPVSIAIAPLTGGVELTDARISLIAENQLFGQRVSQSRRRNKSATDANEHIIKNLTELRLGAAVVHIDHGVGLYRGLQTLSVDGQTVEFLTLEYADQAKLYVPVSSLHLISRYSGVEEASAPLHRLGSEQWQKEKRKAAEKIRDVAAELLDIYARRAARQGHVYRYPKDDYELFCAGFPFEETPDQLQAIEQVITDMKSNQPMDRLICGDVGFGKTEVAMRAVFIAVQDHKQVAVLVPTTLLAQQHFESFKDRFANWPVTIEVLSRFKTAKEQTHILNQLSTGAVDIVIGTHKLLQNNIRFKQLGLLIIDEEHRFGVRHKEKLKALRADVDMLTLTATPIPRTLNMAMSGIRDMSIIATPPEKRLSIKTFVRQSNPQVIKEAILRELRRGGQVYYLHNEVKTIEATARKLNEMIPEARIGVAHGQMRERELESVMSDFYHKRYNLLVCSTIIETGIDVPTANTIIMDRADKLGLAQLHQLRGRVGRSHHQAYAFLLTPPPASMTQDAIKRLEAISEAEDLGAGFTLASHDLEIRGAGELLGDEQSGHIQNIGFTLFMEMLDNAVQAIKAGKTPNLDQPLEQGPEINLRLPALIPEDYLPDVHNRLILYKRIASAKHSDELREIQVEMIDRFGLLPNQVKHLFSVTELKLTAQALGIVKIDLGPQGGAIEFNAQPNVDSLVLIKLIQSKPNQYQLAGADRLRIKADLSDFDARIEFIETLLREIGNQ